ncbi:hypothetical protein Tco_0184045 [Tanacetum coccineum]
MRLASRNQLSESDAQQVARFNNGLRYDIQAIVSLQTTWTIDEAVHIALKAEQTIKKQGIGSSMYKTKTDTNQSSSSQSRGDAQVDHSKSTHEVDGMKCYRCQEVGYTSNQCRATKRVNLAEGDKAHSEYEDEGLIISPDVVFEDDNDHSQAFLGLFRRLVLNSIKKSEDSQWHNIFQTRCKINQDVFNVIIDGGSSENIISRDIVTRLKLRPMKHPKPYKIDIDACHVLLGRPWQSDLNVAHRGKKNTYTFSKYGYKFTLCHYSDEVQATTTKVKKNQIMLCSAWNKEKNICATTIPPDQVLNPIKNSWSSSFQEGENNGGPKLKKWSKR